jgi:predicted N-acetyltransferase YhbS
MVPGFRPTETLTGTHDVSAFGCGKSALDTWLKRHALGNQDLGSSHTFVVCPELDPARVVGYYALTVGSVQLENAPIEVQKDMPPKFAIPVMVLARLAVDSRYRPPVQKLGLGKALLKDALIRTVRVANEAGVRAMLVDALDHDAKGFYERYEFIASPIDELPFFLPMNRIRASVLAADVPKP